MTCLNNTSVVACHTSATGPISAVIHYTFDNAGAPQVHITDSAGLVIAAATVANTKAGQCPVAPNDVEWLTMCDVQADGTIIKFEQRTITSWDSLNVPTSVTTYFAADRVTAYVPTGTVGECDVCQPLTVAQRGVQTTW